MRRKLVTMNVCLPTTLRQRMEEKLGRHGHESASEYVCELIRRDLIRDGDDQVDALLFEGLDSGAAVPVTANWWRARLVQAAKANTHRPGRRV